MNRICRVLFYKIFCGRITGFGVRMDEIKTSYFYGQNTSERNLEIILDFWMMNKGWKIFG
jgi:hypothetical protein